MSKKHAALEEKLRKYALTFPEATEEHPWDHVAIKVRGKTFVFLGGDKADAFSLTVKLPVSAEMAVTLPFVEPAGYGLGKSGWVSVRPGPKDPLDEKLYREWIAQSYRAIAPKKLVKALAAI